MNSSATARAMPSTYPSSNCAQLADKLVDRIIFLAGFPHRQTLDSLQIGQDIRETLEADFRAERSARHL
ncbi:MAG TPA: hypothetical protein VMO81_06125 [Aestuariivirgaceae bacterium]|nr:hypothetical protein [Aestuariivirgaceae bacterium]